MKTTLLTASLLFFLAGCGNTGNNENDSLVSEKTAVTKEGILAQCLTEKGAIMYGTEWCPHCTTQKEAFKTESKEFLPFIDCDKEKGLCMKAKITGYPTWKFADNSELVGAQSLTVLAKKTGCTY